MVKTSELIGPALDWAVAKADGAGVSWDEVAEDFFSPEAEFEVEMFGAKPPMVLTFSRVFSPKTPVPWDKPSGSRMSA